MLYSICVSIGMTLWCVYTPHAPNAWWRFVLCALLGTIATAISIMTTWRRSRPVYHKAIAGSAARGTPHLMLAGVASGHLNIIATGYVFMHVMTR